MIGLLPQRQEHHAITTTARHSSTLDSPRRTQQRTSVRGVVAFQSSRINQALALCSAWQSFPRCPLLHGHAFSSQEVPHSPFPVSCKYSTAVASTSQPPQPSSGYPPLSIGKWGGQPRDCAVQKAALALPGNEAGVHCTNSQFGHPPTLEPQPAICSVLVMCMLLMVVIEIKVGHVSYHLTPLKMRLGPSRLNIDHARSRERKHLHFSAHKTTYHVWKIH